MKIYRNRGDKNGDGKKHNTLAFLLFCIQPQLNSRVTSAGGLKTFQKLFRFYCTRVVFTIYSLGIRSLLSINQDQRSIITNVTGDVGKNNILSNVYLTSVWTMSFGQVVKLASIFELLIYFFV